MNALDYLLLNISLVYIAVVIYNFKESTRRTPDNLSPIKILSAFALLDCINLLWFSIHPDLRSNLILSQIDTTYHTDYNLIASYCVGPIGYLFIVLGINSQTNRRSRKLYSNNSKTEHENPKIYIFMWLLGASIISYWILSNGGLIEIWTKYLLAGIEPELSGYTYILYQTLLCVGASALYVHYQKKSQRIKLSAVIISTVVMLGILGNRGPIMGFLILLILTHNYRIQRIKSFITTKYIVIAAAFVIAATVMVSVRPGSDTYLIGEDASLNDRITRDVIMRIGSLERRIVTVGYFKYDEIWMGRSYLSLVSAIVPKEIFPDKPPVDTGIYLKAIADRVEFTVNDTASRLPKTSWPEGNLAGWMNFHFPGFLLLCMLSGILFCMTYQAMLERNCSYPFIFLYGAMAYWGAPTLSPYGIVRILMAAISVLMLEQILSKTRKPIVSVKTYSTSQ